MAGRETATKVAVSAFHSKIKSVKINIYIDSFNLYYGALKNTPYKWLDVSKMCQYLFQKHQISKIKYFTASVKLRPNEKDLEKPVRQQIYFRALKTIRNLEIYEGSFLVNTVRMKKADNSGYVDVIKTEEKGSDVSLGAHLVNDAHKKEFEMAVVISNDSDLVEPIKIITQELKLPIVIISPYDTNTIKLREVSTSARQIRKGVLKISQFPDELSDGIGKFTKPMAW